MFHSQTHRTKFFLGLAMAGLVAAMAPDAARADGAQVDPTQVAAVAVNARGLDLGTRAGETVLRRRVLAAAYKVCGQAYAGSGFATDSFAQCVQEAAQRATPQVEALVNTARGQDHYVAAAMPQ